MNDQERYRNLYDAAAKGYMLAVQAKDWADASLWKSRMSWLDQVLAVQEYALKAEA